MKKSLMLLLVIVLFVTTGVAYADTLLESDTWGLPGLTAEPFEWTIVSWRDLTPYTVGIAPSKIVVSWRSVAGVATKVRLYKDDVYVEEDVPLHVTSMEFTDPEILGLSCAHRWGVQFKASYTSYYFVMFEPTITFYGMVAAEDIPIVTD